MVGFAAALMLVAFIASIVLTVIGYKRFVGITPTLRIDPKDQRTWGPFLNFDTLIIDKVLKALYMFNAIFLALAIVVLAIAALSEGFGAFVAALIGGAIAIVILELLLRLGYELIMMQVVIARNTSEIKRHLVGGEEADADGISPLSTEPAYVAAPAPVAPSAPAYAPAPAPAAPAPAPVPAPVPVPAPAPAPEPVPAPEPELAPEAAPEAEPEVSAQLTCPVCGAPINAGDKFCAVCGAKLQ